MYGLGFENNPLGAENCMSSKSENLKLLDSFAVYSVFQRMFQGDKLQITMVFTKDTIYPMDSKCVEIIVVKSSANA